jgi:hypothetical protein
MDGRRLIDCDWLSILGCPLFLADIGHLQCPRMSKLEGGRKANIYPVVPPAKSAMICDSVCCPRGQS